MFHEVEAFVLQDGWMVGNEVVEDGVVGLVVCQRHQQRTHYLDGGEREKERF